MTRAGRALQLVITLAGDDQRQRDGAVEQVGAAPLASARGRPGDVEHVVEHLERQSDPAPEVAEAERLARRGLTELEPAWKRRAVLSSQRSR